MVGRLGDERDGAVVLAVAALVAEPVCLVAGFLGDVEDRGGFEEFLVVVLALFRQGALQGRDGLRPGRVGIPEEDEVRVRGLLALPGRIVVFVVICVDLHVIARGRFADDDDDGAGGLGGQRLRAIDMHAVQALVMADAVCLGLRYVAVDILPEVSNRSLRQVPVKGAEHRYRQECNGTHAAGRRLLSQQTARKGHVAAPAGVEEEGEAEDDDGGRQNADVRFDEIDALAPVRQVEGHQGGRRQAVPDNAVVGKLDEGDDDADEVQERHEGGDDLLVTQAEQGGFQGCQQDEFRCADDEVEADLGHVPVLAVRPGVEQRKGCTPEQAREEVRQRCPGKKRHARAVLDQHECQHDGNEDRYEVIRTHILADVNVKSDQADVVDARGRQPADQTILPFRRV